MSSKKRSIRPSPAMLVACLALFVALGSGAYAVKFKLKKNQVKTKNIKNAAVTETKLADGAVTTPKIANNAVTTGKIGDAAVTSGKLEASQRSETFSAETGTTIAVATPISATKTVVQSLSLPAGGKYLVTAQAGLLNAGATVATTDCSLSGVTGNSQAGDTHTGQPDLLFASGGISLSGISTGGTVSLSCASTVATEFAAFRRIDAVRVG